MDEKTAWENFCRTGKVKDYIKYTEVINALEFSIAMQNLENMGQNSTDDNKNTGAYN